MGELSSRTWRAGHLVDEHVDQDELAVAIDDPDTLLWVDLVAPSAAELAQLADNLGLPATAVEDALEPHERPKITRHEGYLFFTVYALALLQTSGSQPTHVLDEPSRISGWVLPHALVTIRLDDRLDMDAIVRRWEDDPVLLGNGAPALVHGLMDAVVDGHFRAIQAIDDQLERLEDVLFEDRPTGATFARGVYELRKDLVALRRLVLPMREVVSALLRHSSTDLPALRPWFDDLYDHVLRAAEWTESLRDLLTSAFETNLSLQDARLNTIMKKLAGWAAIIAVPTAITGWFGQNVPYPGFSEPLGLWLSAGMILGGVVTLYALFRARDWV